MKSLSSLWKSNSNVELLYLSGVRESKSISIKQVCL